jgi:hypothetical protein
MGPNRHSFPVEVQSPWLAKAAGNRLALKKGQLGKIRQRKNRE